MPNWSSTNTPDGVLRGLTAPSSSTVCSCMLPRRGRRKQRGSSTKAGGRACQGWTWGQHTHHTTCRVPDLSEGDQGPLPWSIFTKKVTWPTALWVPMEGRGHPRHPVLPEELLAKVGALPCWRRTNGGLLQPPQPIYQPESWSRSWRRDDPHDEALQESREPHQWVLEAAQMLELNIERLSQRVESTQYQCPCSCSSSHLWSRSLDRCERSLDRHERSPSWH